MARQFNRWGCRKKYNIQKWIFKKINCDIDNLMLVTKGENAVLSRKHYRFSDPDLTGAALGLVRLEQAIGKKKKTKQRKGQK